MLKKSSQIQELEDLIKYHRKKYWIDNEPEISDPEYDELEEKLRQLDPDNPLLNEIVDAPIRGQKFKHPKPMLSLDKVYTKEDLEKWLRKISRSDSEKFRVSPKYDGNAGRLYSLKLLVTRGDGIEGVNISSKIPNLNIITKYDKFPIDGELILQKDYFYNVIQKKIKRKDGKPYKTPRNCAGGLVNTLDPLPLDICIDFIDYNVESKVYSLTELLEKWDEIYEKYSDPNYHYPLDGIVIRVHDDEYFEELGSTEHHPRGAIAFKFTNPKGITKLVDVLINVGTTRRLTFTGIVEPVEIGGVTVTKVSLHNPKYIIDNDIQIGDVIEIQRSGDVIPDYVRTIEKPKDRKRITIDECPSCGSELIYEEPFLICSNKYCGVAAVRKLATMCKRIGLQLVGEKTAAKLFEVFGITRVSEVLNLEWDHIAELPGFTGSSIDNLYEEIQRVRNLDKIYDYIILSASGIENIGKGLFKQICQQFTVSELLEMDIEDLHNKVEGIGEERAFILYEALHEKNVDELRELYEIFDGRIVDFKFERQDLKGTICFTGRMPKKRSYYEDLAKQYGFEPVKTVSKKLDLLVTVTKNHSSSKVNKAKKWGVRIISLDEFLASVGG